MGYQAQMARISENMMHISLKQHFFWIFLKDVEGTLLKCAIHLNGLTCIF